MKNNKEAVSLSEVSRHFGLSRTAVRDLELRGEIDRVAGLDACRLAYIRYLRARRLSHSDADMQWRLARAREIEIRTAQRERKLMQTDEAIAVLEDVVGTFLTELSSLPAAVTRDVVLRRQIEEKIFEIRTRIADRFEAQLCSLRESGKAAA